MRVNRDIRAKNVLLIDAEGNNLGKVYIKDALRMAQDVEMDLVEVSDNKNELPVCKIIDYGKHKYDKSKKQGHKKSQRKQTKEFQFRPNTDLNDLSYRAKRVKKFLESGHKIRLIVKFKGREAAHMFDTGKALLEKFLDLLKDASFTMDQTAKTEGKSIVLHLHPPSDK